MKIIKGKIASAKKVVIYGPEGIGKSTFASHFPEPLFIDTEGSTKTLNVSRFEKASSWVMLTDQVRYVMQSPDVCQTLVIDTVDWAEQMCVADLCARNGKKGIEDFGYGTGYVYAKEEFGRFLNLLNDVIEKGIHVVLTAHAQIRKFEQPDEMGAYDRWELKLGKKTQSQTSPLIKEWADMVLFANYKTVVVNVDGQGAQKGKNKVQGGRRVMYTAHHVCWDAKNRYNLPEEVPFEYTSIAHIIEKRTQSTAYISQSERKQILEQESEPKEPKNFPLDLPQNTPASSAQPAPDPQLPPPRVLIDSDPEKVPKALVDLMREYKVIEWDVQQVCEQRGYVPTGTPLDQYDKANPGIIEGLLIPCWDQVYQMIQETKGQEELPFN